MATSLYPGAYDAYTERVDYVDKVMANDVNELQAALEAIEPTLGTNPQGSAPDLKTRLDNAISSLGTEIVASTAAFHGGFGSGHGITINAAGDLLMTGNLTVSGTASISGAIGLSGTTADSWTIDSDSSSTAPALVLGTTYNKRLTWANASARFEFNDVVYATKSAGAGTLTAGTFTATSSSAAITCGVLGSSAGTTSASAYGAMGVADNISSTANYGVWGQALAVAGTATGYGVYGSASSTVAASNLVYGVYGLGNCGTGGTASSYGVYGTVTGNGTRYAVYGLVAGTVGTAYGGYFTTTGTTTANYAVYGNATNATTNWAGYFDGGNVYHKNKILIAASDATSLAGVQRIRVQDTASNYTYTGTLGSLFENSAAGNIVALMGASASTDASGATVANGIIGQGVMGNNATVVRGVYGSTYNSGAYTGATTYALYGLADATNGGGGANFGLYASASGGATNWAGYFNLGNVYIKNNLGLNTTPNYPIDIASGTTTRGVNIALTAVGSTTYGVYSSTTAASSNSAGVYSTVGANTGNIYGTLSAVTGTPNRAMGVYGLSSSTSAIGDGYGVWGAATGVGTVTNYGIYGEASGGVTGNWAGYFGTGDVYITNKLAINSTADYALNVVNISLAVNSFLSSSSVNTYGDGNSYTLYATKSGATVGPNVAVGGFSAGGTSSRGIYGLSTGTGTAGYGGYFDATGAATTNYGIYATSSGAGTNWAGYFVGNVYVSGSISGGAIGIAGTTSDTWTIDTDDSSTDPALILGTTYDKRLTWVNANARFEFNGAVYLTGDLTDYEAVNDANPEVLLGSSAAERLHIQSVYDGGAQTLNYVLFQTDVASGTADKGQFKFNVDGTEIFRVDDGGIEVVGGISLTGTIVGVTTAITGTKNNALTISIPTQGVDDANGQNLSISAEDAGSGGTGNHNGGNLVLAGGAKQGSGTAGAVTINSAWTATGQTCADLGTVVTATMSGRMHLAKGINVASANDLTLGADGNFFAITGAVTVNAITTTGWQAGSRVTLLFTGAPTVKHNTAGGAGTAPMLLAGSSDFSAANNSILDLIYDGTQWQEISRKVA